MSTSTSNWSQISTSLICTSTFKNKYFWWPQFQDIFVWYVGKSLLGTAAVNVAIICIFNIRRRENSLMKQILDLGEGDFSMAMSKRESKKRNIKNIFSCLIIFLFSNPIFFSIKNLCMESWKSLLIFLFFSLSWLIPSEDLACWY